MVGDPERTDARKAFTIILSSPAFAGGYNVGMNNHIMDNYGSAIFCPCIFFTTQPHAFFMKSTSVDDQQIGGHASTYHRIHHCHPTRGYPAKKALSAMRKHGG